MYHSRTFSQKIPDPDERGGRGPLGPPPKSAPVWHTWPIIYSMYDFRWPAETMSQHLSTECLGPNPTLFGNKEGSRVDFYALVSGLFSLLGEKKITGTSFHMRKVGKPSFSRFWANSKIAMKSVLVSLLLGHLHCYLLSYCTLISGDALAQVGLWQVLWWRLVHRAEHVQGKWCKESLVCPT